MTSQHAQGSLFVHMSSALRWFSQQVVRYPQETLQPAYAFTTLVTVFAAGREAPATFFHAVGAVGQLAALKVHCIYVVLIYFLRKFTVNIRKCFLSFKI